MATTTAQGSGSTVNNGGTVLNGGNVPSTAPVSNTLTLANSAVERQEMRPKLAVSPNESSNLGTTKANDSRNFAQMEAGEYIGKVITDKVGGVANTTPAKTGAEYSHRVPINVWRGYHSKGAISISNEGVLSYAGGSDILPSGIDGGTGPGEDVAGNPTDAVPGKLVVMINGVNPSQSSYRARYGN